MVAVGDAPGMACNCHQLDVKGVGIANIHAAGKEGVHVVGEGAGAVSVTTEVLECVLESGGFNCPTGDLATISLVVVDIGNIEGGPVSRTVAFIFLASVHELLDAPLQVVPYLVEVTVADWIEVPASIIGVAAAAPATERLVHVPVLDVILHCYMVLGGNSILSQAAFLVTLQACVQANFCPIDLGAVLHWKKWPKKWLETSKIGLGTLIELNILDPLNLTSYIYFVT